MRLALLLTSLACLTSPAIALGDECAAFATQVSIADVRVVSAGHVGQQGSWLDRAGKPGAPVGADFCRLTGVIEQEIGFELWLPTRQTWNGKFLAAGVGGEAGTLNYADMARGLRRGYAAASTDTGHRIEDVDWALGRPDRRANFAARANHLLAVKSKALIQQFYSRNPARSYFVGCSGGGREGLKEVQAYPDDFDGVLAGGAGPNQLAASARLLWSQYVVGPSVANVVDSSVWRRVAAAGTEACDRNDGVADGVVENPAACRFDPAVLQCKPGSDSKDCLSPAQVKAVKTLFAPLENERGNAVDSGLVPGITITLEPRSAFAFSLFGKVVHQDPNWDPRQLTVARDMDAARKAWPDLPNDQPDISAFRNRGGKLLHYHGWLDPWILAQQPIAYHEQVQQKLGPIDDFFRLFMVPGMGHCRGGTGVDRFGGAGADAPTVDADHDMLSALEAWVEQGRAPERIVGARLEGGKVTRTRPLCPYPQVAVYGGSGSTDDAANFRCQKEAPAP